jgi:hypothetical protein
MPQVLPPEGALSPMPDPLKTALALPRTTSPGLAKTRRALPRRAMHCHTVLLVLLITDYSPLATIQGVASCCSLLNSRNRMASSVRASSS